MFAMMAGRQVFYRYRPANIRQDIWIYIMMPYTDEHQRVIHPGYAAIHQFVDSIRSCKVSSWISHGLLVVRA